jgi:hypothetical protein
MTPGSIVGKVTRAGIPLTMTMTIQAYVAKK